MHSFSLSPLGHNPSVEKLVITTQRKQHASPTEWCLQGNMKKPHLTSALSPKFYQFSHLSSQRSPMDLCTWAPALMTTNTLKTATFKDSRSHYRKSEGSVYFHGSAHRPLFSARKWSTQEALSCCYQFILTTQLFYEPFQVIFTQYHNCQQVCSVLATLPFVSVFHKNPFV